MKMMTTTQLDSANNVLSEVLFERVGQHNKWGEQNLPDGTGGQRATEQATRAKALTDRHAQTGDLTWRDVLLEEVFEAIAESDTTRLRAELIQVAAVAGAWVEAIDRRS